MGLCDNGEVVLVFLRLVQKRLPIWWFAVAFSQYRTKTASSCSPAGTITFGDAWVLVAKVIAVFRHAYIDHPIDTAVSIVAAVLSFWLDRNRLHRPLSLGELVQRARSPRYLEDGSNDGRLNCRR